MKATGKWRTTRDNALNFRCAICNALPGELCQEVTTGNAREACHATRHDHACRLYREHGSWEAAWAAEVVPDGLFGLPRRQERSG